MRALAKLWISIFVLVFAAAEAGGLLADEPAADRPLIDPRFEIPDLSDQGALLEARFSALARHLVAMERRLSRQGVDQRLAELFLPERPDRFKGRYAIQLKIAALGGAPEDWARRRIGRVWPKPISSAASSTTPWRRPFVSIA